MRMTDLNVDARALNGVHTALSSPIFSDALVSLACARLTLTVLQVLSIRSSPSITWSTEVPLGSTITGWKWSVLASVWSQFFLHIGQGIPRRPALMKRSWMHFLQKQCPVNHNRLSFEVGYEFEVLTSHKEILESLLCRFCLRDIFCILPWLWVGPWTSEIKLSRLHCGLQGWRVFIGNTVA